MDILDIATQDEKAWLVLTATSDKGTLTIDVSDFAITDHVYSEFYDELGDYEITGIYSNFDAVDFIENNNVIDDVFDILELTKNEISILTAWAYINGTHLFFETSKLIDGMNENYVGSFNSYTELAHWHIENSVDTTDIPDIVKRNINYESVGGDLLWMKIYDYAHDKNLPDIRHFFSK